MLKIEEKKGGKNSLGILVNVQKLIKEKGAPVKNLSKRSGSVRKGDMGIMEIRGYYSNSTLLKSAF
ncbi:MAG: hypothetical protein QME07_02375, partial [bacterium]|nr:hypothetical protein [bacterium]